MKLPVAVYTDISAGHNFIEIPLETDQSTTKIVDGYNITYIFPDGMRLKNQEGIEYSLVIEKTENLSTI